MPANFHESCAAAYHRMPPECLPQVWLSISLVFFRINANGDGNVFALAPHFKVKFDVSKPARLSRAPSNLSGVSMNTFGVRILEYGHLRFTIPVPFQVPRFQREAVVG
jgi:hypothetical protein